MTEPTVALPDSPEPPTDVERELAHVLIVRGDQVKGSATYGDVENALASFRLALSQYLLTPDEATMALRLYRGLPVVSAATKAKAEWTIAHGLEAKLGRLLSGSSRGEE